MAVADSLGAMNETALREKGIMVRNYTCSGASAVRAESSVCRECQDFRVRAGFINSA
jgi:hypothetical protein